MSNHLAFATVTATLQHTLQSAIQTDVDGARATTLRPNEIGNGTPESGVNIFLYQIITNPALHNIDATPLRSRGNSVKRQAALDLYYILSFYGNDNELIPQRLLGSVVKTLNDNRVMTADMIRETCDRSTITVLQQSNLADQLQQISIMPLDLTLEDLSKTWGVFFQTPYVLSVAYKVLVVLVEGEEGFKRSLPIRQRQMGDMAAPLLNRPTVEQVFAKEGRFQPIDASSTLEIRCKYLKGDRLTQVRIGNLDITPPDVSENRILLPLSIVPFNLLHVGVQTLQVVHPAHKITPMERSPDTRRSVESNAISFVLCPTLEKIEITEISGSEQDPRSGQLQLHLNVKVRPQQRVAIALNEWSTQKPTDYLLDAEVRSEDTQDLLVKFQNVKPGDYLIRIIVDGAESQLEIDTNTTSPTYQWFVGPRILII
ncbi:MAG: DUF4255 domain-containing protein [Leptolyngbyaceae bacterium]|nr:DUF4255 domain-containing protein [Leptolyngbyaceae bacterium]